MNSDPWWDYFDEDPREKIGRYVTGPFGVKVIICLARVSWAWIDWYDERTGTKNDTFFRKNLEMHDPGECDADTWMEGAVHQSYLREAKVGTPLPPWCPRPLPEEYKDIDVDM